MLKIRPEILRSRFASDIGLIAWIIRIRFRLSEALRAIRDEASLFRLPTFFLTQNRCLLKCLFESLDVSGIPT